MITLIVSDTHVGDPRFDSSGTIDIIKKTKFDRLVLNGDIVDFWLINEEKAKKDPLIQEIQKIALEKEVVWVHGNHDYYAKECGLLDNVKVLGMLKIHHGSQTTLILHGHQIYRNENRGFWSKIGAKFNVFMYRHFKIDIQKFFNTGKIYEWIVKKKRKNIISTYGSDVNNIVIGHTHVFGTTCVKNKKLYDIGSTVMFRSYAIVEDENVLLISEEK
jgi:UDP-2,3-diacylglucosamine pyrophosphatase LpxH